MFPLTTNFSFIPFFSQENLFLEERIAWSLHTYGINPWTRHSDPSSNLWAHADGRNILIVESTVWRLSLRLKTISVECGLSSILQPYLTSSIFLDFLYTWISIGCNRHMLDRVVCVNFPFSNIRVSHCDLWLNIYFLKLHWLKTNILVYVMKWFLAYLGHTCFRVMEQ